MAVCSIIRTMNIISQVWSSQTNYTTLWHELALGRQCSAYGLQLASIKSALLETTWSRKRLMIWFCVPLLTKIEYWSMNWIEKLRIIIGLRGDVWWLTRNICSFRPLFCTQLQKVREGSEFIMQLFRLRIFPTCPLIILIQALWHCFGLVVPLQGQASTKETSNRSRLRHFSICKNCAEHMLVHLLKQVSSKHPENYQRWHSTSLSTYMAYLKRLLFLQSHKHQLVVNISTLWPT